jgi:hypothetical protein
VSSRNSCGGCRARATRASPTVRTDGVSFGIERDDTLWDNEDADALARHTLTGSFAALKVLPRKHSQKLGLRFLNEARLLSRQDHPNIVRLIESGTLDDGSPYMLMERR